MGKCFEQEEEEEVTVDGVFFCLFVLEGWVE